VFAGESPDTWQQLRTCLAALVRPWRGWWNFPRWRSFDRLPLSERAGWLERFSGELDAGSRLALQTIRSLVWQAVYGPTSAAAASSDFDAEVPSEAAFTSRDGGQNHTSQEGQQRNRQPRHSQSRQGAAEAVQQWWHDWQAERSEATGRATRNAGLEASPLRSGQSTVACDYLVIGSGVAGAVMAAELAETGRRVLLVERASLVDRESFLWPPSPSLVESWGTVARPEQPVWLQTASAWGGSSLNAEPGLLDPSQSELAQWAQAWGWEELLSDDFRHSLFTVRRRLDLVEKDDDDNPLTRTWLENAALALGLQVRRAHSSCVLASRACELCQRGCASGDWADARNTYLMDAQRLGVYLLPQCEVVAFETEDGQAVAAQAWLTADDGQRRELTIRFRHAVCCAGALHTPRILQRSGLVSATLGQRLRLHPSIWVAGELPAEIPDIALDRMLVANGQSLDSVSGWCDLRPVSVNPWRASMAVPFRDATDHKRWLQRWERLVLIQVTLRDEGHGFIADNRFGVKPGEFPPGGRDAEIRYRMSATDRARLIAGGNMAMRWLRGAGCPVVFSPWDSRWRLHAELDEMAYESIVQKSQRATRRGQLPPMWSAYATSTCRVADSPMRGAVSRRGQLFGLDNVFVTDASILPTATSSDPRMLITTLSHYLAQGIKVMTS
jgi:hypothetical protein